MNIEMELAKIIIRETSDEQIIVLKEKGGERALPVVIGSYEAVTINRYVNQYVPPRPLTHDLITGILQALRVRLEQVIVNDLREHTFYAQLILNREGEIIVVDSRPSDAIALSIFHQCPVFVAEHVLDAVL